MNPSDNGYQYITIGTIGTAVQRAIPTVLHGVYPEVSVGTVTLYDSATAAGTASSNRIYTFTGGTAAQDCYPRHLDVQCKSGLVSVSLGTPICTLAVI